MYGLTGYEFARHALEMRHELESVFMVVTFGDLVGVPVLPPVYSLRLLPYVVPEIATWKRHMARSREFWEKHRSEEHTSELQSSQISYAVFCLKKKKNTNIDIRNASSSRARALLRLWRRRRR